jgi:hypothetical protein
LIIVSFAKPSEVVAESTKTIAKVCKTDLFILPSFN